MWIATVSYSGGGFDLLCSLHPALFVPALHDRPCFSCRIALPCFDYLYPISEYHVVVYVYLPKYCLRFFLPEWYDFTIYTQLSKTLGKLFFPNKDPVLTQLSFWGVYALGFISRPAGAILFGHIGDSKGRGMCLLLSVLLMGIPTVLIGCLPTYNHIGLAAPILLAFLRLIQGLAMGGEFGAGE